MSEDLPVCCTLTPAARDARRRDQLLPGLLARSARHEPTADGYRFTFDTTPDVLASVLRVIEHERQCCRFLRFALIVEPDLGPVRLDVTGPPGTREFLADLLTS